MSHDNGFPTMWYVRLAKDQNSLRIGAIWSEPLLVIEHSMIVKLLTEHHLECLSLKGGCRGSSESTHVKMPHCWKSYTLAHIVCTGFIFHFFSFQGRHSKEAQCRRATPCVCTALVSISSLLLLYTLLFMHSFLCPQFYQQRHSPMYLRTHCHMIITLLATGHLRFIST